MESNQGKPQPNKSTQPETKITITKHGLTTDKGKEDASKMEMARKLLLGMSEDEITKIMGDMGFEWDDLNKTLVEIKPLGKERKG